AMCKQTGTKGDTICDIELGNNPYNNELAQTAATENQNVMGMVFNYLREYLSFLVDRTQTGNAYS
ncbi:MAG: hypothetical protein WAM42_19060, partial [Candidatus Nitrosopolaris sp.]